MEIHFAPLQGYTDALYRRLHEQIWGGADAYYTPFVRIEGDGFRNKDLRDISRTSNSSDRVVPQMLPGTPDELKRLTELFLREGYDRADINLGCPFPMIARRQRGAGIWSDTDKAEALLSSVALYPEMRFSLKMRLGWQTFDETWRLLPLLCELPLTHIALHARLGVQQYKGVPDFESFSRFYEQCTLPLFYNGDLCTTEQIDGIMARYPALRGVMIGRGLLAAPWLASEYKNGVPLANEERLNRLRLFHDALCEEYRQSSQGEHQWLARIRTLWDYLLPDTDKRLRKPIVKATRIETYRLAVERLWENLYS